MPALYTSLPAQVLAGLILFGLATLVGRDAELARLAAAGFGAQPSGRLHTAVEAGIGTILARLMRHSNSDG